MKFQNVLTVILLVAAALVAGGIAGYLIGHRPQGAAAEDAAADEGGPAPAPVATVATAPAADSDITQTLTVYGTVVPQADARRAIVAPLDLRIERLLVVPGHSLKAGDPAVAVGPSPDMRLAYQQAKDALAAAQGTMKNTQQRYDLKLATTADLEQAKTALNETTVRLNDLKQRGADHEQTLPAPQAGIVGKIEVSLGQIVTAGTPLLWIDDPQRVEARLGIVPEDASLISVGQQATLAEERSAASQPVHAAITVVTRQVNPDTHLVDVLAPLPAGRTWLLGAPITAEITTERHRTLVVPRSAVLPREGHDMIFTIHDGHAVEHQAVLGLQNNDVVEIASAEPPLTAGEAVVIQGNYELDDAMAVTVSGSGADTQKAKSKP